MFKASDGINFDVDFLDKYNIIYGDSASGKTYLREFLKMYCKAYGILLLQIDYSMSKDIIIASINRIRDECNALIYIDNGDIVLDKDIELAIINTNADTKVFVVHNLSKLSLVQYLQPGLYKLVLTNDICLSSKRIGQL